MTRRLDISGGLGLAAWGLGGEVVTLLLGGPLAVVGYFATCALIGALMASRALWRSAR